MVPRLREKYEKEVVPVLMKEFGYKSIMEVPRIRKVVLNMGLGEAVQEPKVIDRAMEDLALIAGQRPYVRKARRSIAAFKLRKGMPIGVAVTLRKERMWDFMDRLVNLALPRVRDFRGVSDSSFDGQGNYTLGLREQIIFHEIDYDKVDKVRGLSVTVVTTAKMDEEARTLLAKLGMPFIKRGGDRG
jgi:large subunit ribosomal protein L5